MVTPAYLLFEKAKQQFLQFKPSEYVFGPSSEIFVGRMGYPNLAVGPLVGLENMVASPKELFGMDYADIIARQTSLVRGKKKASVNSRMQTDMKEVALSSRAIDVEMELTKRPYFDLKTDGILQTMGASAPIKKFAQAENPKIPKKVDSIIGEKLTATEAIAELTAHGFDNYYATNILAVGALGMDETKRLVPTRWSITAVDDIIAKQRMERIRGYMEINEVSLYSSSFLDNHFHVLLMPGKWEFENFESWPEGGAWAGTNEEYEGYHGRTKYAEKQVGGYYASRFAVTEYLDLIRRQAKVVVFREIGEGYVAPVGVWQVRENVRHALAGDQMKFGSTNEALAFLSTKLNVKMKKYFSMSRILCQRRLSEF